MLLGMHGKKQAGKDTAYQRLLAICPEYQVERVSFADLLYRSAAAALGVTVEELYKWKVDSKVSIRVVRRGRFRRYKVITELTFRQYLQLYGTEAHRDVFGSDFWVAAVDLYHKGKIVVVTDVRFPNEAAAIHEHGGVVVQIIGPPQDDADTHESETPLPRELVDYVVDNTNRSIGLGVLEMQLDAIVATEERERGA